MLKNKIIKIYSLFIIVILLVSLSIPFLINANFPTTLNEYNKTQSSTNTKVNKHPSIQKQIPQQIPPVNTLNKSISSTDSEAMEKSINDVSKGTLTYKPLEDLPGVKTNNLGVYLGGMFELAIGIATALAVLMIVIGGFKYMTVEASHYSIEEAKEQIKGALIGLVLVLASWLILKTINTDFVNFNTNLEPVVPIESRKTTKSRIIQKVEDLGILKTKKLFSGDTINMEELEKAVKNNELTEEDLKALSEDPKTPVMFRSKIKNLFKNIKNSNSRIDINTSGSDEFTGAL